MMLSFTAVSKFPLGLNINFGAQKVAVEPKYVRLKRRSITLNFSLLYRDPLRLVCNVQEGALTRLLTVSRETRDTFIQIPALITLLLLTKVPFCTVGSRREYDASLSV